MNRVLTLVAVASLLTAVGCQAPQQVAPDQFKQALEWTAEYPELVEPLNKAIEDDNFDEEEYKDFSGRYHTLVNKTNMEKVRGKLADIKAQATKSDYEELLAKVKANADAQGLEVRETDTGIELVKKEVTPSEQANKVVTTETLDPKAIDRAIEQALSKPNIVEEED